MKGVVYPFVAIVGQEKVKRALILNAINPKIGGVLLSGQKGTAKSTLVRGLGDIARGMDIVTLPLNVTEDRLVGTLDIEKTISQGQRHFEPGILKTAHGNILYVDEVNLLSDHIVNCLLETAASGINRVEREGLSFAHESQFALVGTMNPEEGRLRAQFLDRFGLYVEVESCSQVLERKAIIQGRIDYEQNPAAFVEKHDGLSQQLTEAIEGGRKRLKTVRVSDAVVQLAAEIAAAACCAGHRAELVIVETAKALAAFEKRNHITLKDIQEAAEYALPHRKREHHSEPAPMPPKEQEEHSQSPEGSAENSPHLHEEAQDQNRGENLEPNGAEGSESEAIPEESQQQSTENNSSDQEQTDDIGRIFAVRNMDIYAMDRKKRKGAGKRVRTKTDSRKGQYVRSIIPKNKLQDLAFDATLRAAAPFQNMRNKNGLALAIKNSDLREKVREKRTGTSILFVVDASGSMGAKKRMAAVKGAVVSLLADAYQKRDKVGLVAFRKNSAETLLNITRSVEMAQKCLKTLPTGGKTPLAAGLVKGYEMIKTAQKKDPDVLSVMVLVSDGRTNVALQGTDALQEALDIAYKIQAEGIHTIVVDTEQDFIQLGMAKDMAGALGGLYYKLEDLEGEQLAEAVRAWVG